MTDQRSGAVIRRLSYRIEVLEAALREIVDENEVRVFSGKKIVARDGRFAAIARSALSLSSTDRSPK